MKKLTVPFYADPGHGWVKVKKSVLRELKIADKISPFSYQRGEFAYLEEDCDLESLLNACADSGIFIRYTFCTTSKSSKIRSYEQYRI